MKYITLLLLAFSLHADPVTLAWDPVADSAVTGYRLYWGPSSRGYTNSVLVSGRLNTTNTIYTLPSGVYFFGVTSVAGSLESAYSNEVSWTNRPAAPGNLRVVWSGSTNSAGQVTPIASVNPGPGFTVNATMTGPWGSVNRSGSTDTSGEFRFLGRAANKPFTASATITKLSYNPSLTSSQNFN